MEANRNNGRILNFKKLKSSRSYCTVCGTGRRPRETWKLLCDSCEAWEAIARNEMETARLFKAAR